MIHVDTSQIARELANKWKCQHPGCMNVPGHECSSRTCTIVNVIGWISEKDHGIHVSLEKPKTKKRKKIKQLYICKNTGNPHWCHSQCEGTKVVSNDQGRVCIISGIRYESERADTWVPQYRITATAQEHRDPHDILVDTKYTSHTKSYRKQQHVAFAKEKIFLLMFSDRRLYAEQRKYFEQRQSAEKIVQKYYKSCERSRHTVCFSDMITLYINQIQRRRVFHGLLPKNHKKDDIVQSYAERVCTLWSIITTKTPMGQNSSSLFSFKTFVVSALYIMKRGMFCNGIEIIPKDYYLESVLPEANTLDHYSINKPAFTQSKNNMMRAIRDAIEIHHIDVKTLVMPTFVSPFK
jgi:hypothetical protein